MNTLSLLAAAGVLFLLGAADASAGGHRDRRHPGHRARLSTATYTTPLRAQSRVLRTVEAPAARGRTNGAVRFAQVGHHHSLMRGS